MAFDDLVGLYFVNHLDQINLLDDPRTNVFALQVEELRRFVEKDSIYLLERKKKRLDELVNNFLLKEIKWKKKRVMDAKKSKLSLMQSEIDIGKQEWEDLQVIITEIDSMTTRLENDQTDQLKAQRLIQKEIEKIKSKIVDTLTNKEALIQVIANIRDTSALLGNLREVEIKAKLSRLLIETIPKGEVTKINKGFPVSGSAESSASINVKGKGVSNKVAPVALSSVKYDKKSVTRVERELELLQLKVKTRN